MPLVDLDGADGALSAVRTRRLGEELCPQGGDLVDDQVLLDAVVLERDFEFEALYFYAATTLVFEDALIGCAVGVVAAVVPVVELFAGSEVGQVASDVTCEGRRSESRGDKVAEAEGGSGTIRSRSSRGAQSNSVVYEQQPISTYNTSAVVVTYNSLSGGVVGGQRPSVRANFGSGESL